MDKITCYNELHSSTPVYSTYIVVETDLLRILMTTEEYDVP